MDKFSLVRDGTKWNDLKTLLKLFPYIKDKDRAIKLKIDKESIYYISIRKHAEQISTIIENYINKLGYESKDITITDATAGVGGNTISFGKTFKNVNAIEINHKRFEYLKNNLNIYNLKNIKVYEGDCIKIIDKIKYQDVIFIDPPWGGKKYKKFYKLKLFLSNVSLEKLCKIMMNKKTMISMPKLIVLKLPINYDLTNFNKLFFEKSIYLHNLGKMLIMIIVV